MHRLLIADNDEGFILAIRSVLSADFEIETCTDGETAIELLSDFQPHALIINLCLPYVDGLTVLQTAPYIPPVIIATTAVISPLIQKSCEDLHISYLMISPCLHALRSQTVNLVNQWASGDGRLNLEKQCTNILHNLGIPTHRTGYRELCALLPLYYQNRDVCLDVELYPKIADMLNKSTGQAVERAIRTVISKTWATRNSPAWLKYFPNHSTCPSNKVFFDAIADHLRE